MAKALYQATHHYNNFWTTKLKPRWDVHLPGAGNRAGGLAAIFRPLIAGPSGSGASPRVSGWPHPLTEERTFQHHFEITRPEPKRKPKIVRKPKPKEEKPRKAPTPKRTSEEQHEACRLHERARNRTPERREYRRRYAEEQRQRAKLLGKCQNCSKPAIPSQSRCETCAEAHRQSPRRSYAERKAAAEIESTAME